MRASVPTAPPPDPVRGIVFKVLASIAMAMVGACVKALGQDYPLGEIVFCRSFFMLLPLLAFAAMDPAGFSVLKTTRLRAHARRAIAGILGLVTSFGTILLLPLADATALTFSAPLVLVALAGPLLGERIGPYRVGAVVIGFIGVLLIVQPHASAGADDPRALWGIALGMLSAVCVALVQIAVRALRDEPATTTVFYFALFLTGTSLLTLPFGWIWPRTPVEALLLFSLGIIGGFAQLAVTHSYRFADASILAPYDYLQLIWAVIVGYVIFGEAPLPIILAGSFIVAASGVFIALRERWLMRRGAKIEDHTARPTV